MIRIGHVGHNLVPGVPRLRPAGNQHHSALTLTAFNKMQFHSVHYGKLALKAEAKIPVIRSWLEHLRAI